MMRNCRKEYQEAFTPNGNLKRKIAAAYPIRRGLVGLKGEVFNAGGRVAFLIPPRDDADVMFEIKTVMAATKKFPSWADMTVTAHGKEIYCRIAPEICENLYRLADCVVPVSQVADRFPFEGQALLTFGGEDFLFWQTYIAGYRVVMIEKKSRLERWTKEK